MGRILFGIFAFFAIISIAVGFTLIRPNIPYEELKEKHAVSASNYIELEDGSLVHYLDTGAETNSETLLLLHGFASSAFEWRPWIKEIKGRYRIIAVDMPAHGLTINALSYIQQENGHLDFLTGFIDELGIEHLSIGGSGIGGKISLEYAAAFPEKINAIILIAPNGWAQTEYQTAHDPIIKEFRRYPLLSPILNWVDIKPFIHAKMTHGFANDHPEKPKLVDSLSDFAHAKGHRKGLELRSRQIGTENLAEYSHNLPVLILKGDRDQISPEFFSVRLNQDIERSTLLNYEMMGHFLHIESPKRSLNDVLYFLTDTKLALSRNSHQSLESNLYKDEKNNLTQEISD